VDLHTVFPQQKKPKGNPDNGRRGRGEREREGSQQIPQNEEVTRMTGASRRMDGMVAGAGAGSRSRSRRSREKIACDVAIDHDHVPVFLIAF